MTAAAPLSLGLLAALAAALAPGAPGALRRLGRADLEVTQGALAVVRGGQLAIDVPKVRAVAAGTAGDRVELRFIWRGPTQQQVALGSGAARRQLGVKLKAQDPCNLVYAMWRDEPGSRLVVSVKRNAGQSTSRECGNRGYRTVRPRRAAALPSLLPGRSHVLRAELTGQELRVFVDGALSWEGALGAEVTSLRGPAGLRTDNARIAFELLAP